MTCREIILGPADGNLYWWRRTCKRKVIEVVVSGVRQDSEWCWQHEQIRFPLGRDPS